MKCRVFKKQDGGVIYNWPSESWQNVIDDCPIPSDLQGLDYIIMNLEDLPEQKEGFYHEQLHFEGDSLRVDSQWNKQLMPPFLIKQKHLKKIDEKLDLELQKVDPDMVELIKLNRNKEKIPSFNDLQMLELALQGLDERVRGGESDKPIIREKLNNKIRDLRRGA